MALHDEWWIVKNVEGKGQGNGSSQGTTTKFKVLI